MSPFFCLTFGGVFPTINLYSMTKRRRIRLSFMVAKTRRLMIGFFGVVVLLVGASHLFLLNRVSMKGYRLSKISEQHIHLASFEEQLDARIAHLQTREYLADLDQLEVMIYRERGNFVVIKEAFTAQKGVNFQNNF